MRELVVVKAVLNCPGLVHRLIPLQSRTKKRHDFGCSVANWPAKPAGLHHTIGGCDNAKFRFGQLERDGAGH